MKTKLSILALALSSFLAAPAMADFSVNIGAISVMPDESSSNLNVIESVAGLPAGSTGVGVSNNTQLGLTFDYRYNENFGLQLIAATPFSHDLKVKGSAIDGLNIGKTKHLPPTLMAQYHFTQHALFQPFVGIGVNYTTFFDEQVGSDLEGALIALDVTTASDNVSLSLSESWGIAVQAGFNYQLSERMGIHFMVSKMAIDTTGKVKVNGTTVQSVNVDIDPVVAMLGFRWKI
ncbi:MAG: outer membrane beta-barrel protein [Idiomarina sp.]|nr:outer membrane beta-barrel protein [Idiomarina sp.]